MTLDELKKAIEVVLEYNWNKELEDYTETRDETGVSVQRDSTGARLGEVDHIFVTMVKLDGFLYGHERTADEFADEAMKADGGPPYDAATATGMYDRD